MLKSYVFDLDQNIVNTKTPIYLLIKQPDGSRKEEAVPNSDFEKKLTDKENVKLHDNPDHSFRQFRGSGKLIKDVFDALSDKAFWPSREKFKTATIEASPTHIITARGNPMEEFRKLHKAIIYEILTEAEREEFAYNIANHMRSPSRHYEMLIEQYLKNNLYIPCADPETIKRFKRGKKSPHEKKAAAFEKTIKQTIHTYEGYYGRPFMKNRHITIGFSDDSKKNVEAITQLILEKLAYKYPNIIFYLYNTEYPQFIRKETIRQKNHSTPLF